MDKPWLNEPNHLEWFTVAGLLGVVHRTEGIGHLCGYVRVPAGHPWHGQDNEMEIDARVHGGVTYSRPYKPGGPEPDADGGWWVGFDCAHSGDFTPGTAAFLGREGPSGYETYRNVEYVKGEVEHLARQAKALMLDTGLAPCLAVADESTQGAGQ
jgi:hypothetical protein